ncbi:hypothetical protein OUZ56_032849 [Daphnia magna]|uniref:Ty3 transposon capsid-like protein domain-containing protein n=1 Tax=Daphnia magna TaxID=35525 RepID=A0ABR0B9Q9_9CRUS|nr:hypothetical protein OUZ56_032849 [Daphnia magna]
MTIRFGILLSFQKEGSSEERITSRKKTTKAQAPSSTQTQPQTQAQPPTQAPKSTQAQTSTQAPPSTQALSKTKPLLPNTALVFPKAIGSRLLVTCCNNRSSVKDIPQQLLPATATPPSKKVVTNATFPEDNSPNETVKNNNETLEEKFLICASFASCKCSTLLSPSLQTALNENTLLPLYPVLEESDLTDQDPNLSHHREQFLDHWKTLIDLEFKQDLERSKSYQTISTTENIQQLQTQKKEASQATQNSLHFYTYYLLEQTVKVTDGVTAETIANASKTLKDDIVAQGGNTRTLDRLLQQLHKLHGKEKEFLFGTISVLQKESVIARIEDKKQISTLKFELSNAQKQLESNKKKAKSSKYTLSSSLEQFQENNEALKNSLEKANSRIADLEQNLKTTLATESQLQNLLKRKEENNAAVETEGQEIINKLEGEKTRLIQKLSTAENQIKQLQKEIKVLADRLDKALTEKINLKKNLLDFTSKNKKLEKDLQELQDRTEDSNDSRLDEDEPGEITKLVGDISELTLPTDSGDKSLHYELEIKQTNDFEQTIENLKTQIEHLNKTIIYLEQENQQLKKKFDMGVTHDDEDTSEKTFANTSKKNPKDDDIPATEQDEEDAKKVNRYFTQPIVKALGKLFSREDKKAIPIFKGKSTDKLISEWLRGAEHVAQNNEWDDNQKIGFFSDRLKGEAFEWHENYPEEEGDDLNYQDWKEALITRFQDTYDLATLEKKLSKLTQKPEENCRAFMSRLNNLYDTIAGKEERADHN